MYANIKLALVISTVALLSACGGGGDSGGSTTIPSSTAASSTATVTSVSNDAAINAAVENAKTVISAMMRDPASTTFQRLMTYRIGSDDTVCGEVNAKNGFGAYTGYQTFYYRPKTYSPFTFSKQTTTTGVAGRTVDAATATLIATVCGNITSQQADDAQTSYLDAVQKAYGL